MTVNLLMTTSIVLACDIDGTMVPTEPHRDSLRAITDLSNLLDAAKYIDLAYVTGRHFSLAQEAIEEYQLPKPEYLICDVGTSIFTCTSSGWQCDDSYANALSDAWGNIDAKDIASLLSGFTELREQEACKQAKFKLSYYLDVKDNSKDTLDQIRNTLRNRSIQSELIYSVDPVTDIGLLDVLPANASKLSALSFLLESLKVKPESLVYAGDSGNDLAVFTSGCRSIVVANTPTSVRSEVENIAKSQGFSQRIYFSRAPYTAGVLEGCRYFGLFLANEQK